MMTLPSLSKPFQGLHAVRRWLSFPVPKKPPNPKPKGEEKKKQAFSCFLHVLRNTESYYSNLYLISLD